MRSRKILSKYIFIFTLIFFFQSELNAQLRVKIRKVTDAGYTTIDPWQYPLMKVRLRAESAGTPVRLSKENILVLENNKISQPVSVGEFETDTTTGELWQLVKWYTRREGPNLSHNQQVVMVDTFYVFEDDEIAKIPGWYDRKDLSFVKVQNFKSENIIEMEFKEGAPGSSQIENLIVKALLGKIDGSGTEGQIWIDSVNIHSENFRIKWDGWVQDKRPPPLHIWPGMPYFVRLYYEPKDNGYHTDKFSVYYDGGLKQEIMLTGHEFHISDEANNLKLIYPNGNESFTPCQEIVIKWDGFIPGMATYVDFSSNGGSSWSNIGLSDDSTLKWTIPNSATSSGLIRVRQKFNPQPPALLRIDDSPVFKISFNHTGTRLLSANEAGIITEWDAVDDVPVKNYYIDTPNYPAVRIRETGLAYTAGDSIFAVAFYRLSDYPRKDSIAFFNTKDSIPFTRTAIEQGFNTSQVYFDNKKRYMAFVSEMSTKVKIYSAQDGSFIRDLTYDKPVSAFVFNRELEQAAVALMNGEIEILELPDFITSTRLNYSDFPLILEMSLASNGEFLAIGTKAPQKAVFSDNRNDIFVVNIPTDQIIRRLRRTASDPVGLEFSPVSTKLLVGSLDYPQITYWDLPVDDSYKGFKGHEGKLTDFDFSPLGSKIATSSASSDNLYLRKFSYAESDENDNYFEIITPALSIKELNIPPIFIAESVDYNISNAICVDETSLVYFNVDSVSMKQGIHFTLQSPVQQDTVIFPGECLPVHFNYFPLDTGLITDSIIVHTCGSKIVLPLVSRGKMRNIRVINDILEFPPTCMGSIVEKEFAFAINDDPVPVLINNIEILKEDYTPFLCLNIRDVVYQPGDTIYANIRFEPTQLGETVSKLMMYHSTVDKFMIEGEVYGEGIGTDYNISHDDLRFIPEILKRKITVTNKSNNEIYIEKAEIEPEGFFTVTSSLPITLIPKADAKIEILWNEWNGTPPGNVILKLTAGPCAAEKRIALGLYDAYSRVFIPDVYADPKGNATIKIDYKNTTNHPYNGERFFEGEFIINPRLFLPQKVKCPYGTGELIRNDIYNDRRIVGFRVEGDFPEEGRAAEIVGIAGLAEVDTSHINMLESPVFWGIAVPVNIEHGVFHLINICGDRLVIHGNVISNIKVNPNPGEGIVEIEFNSKTAGECIFEVYNNIGVVEFQSGSIQVSEGGNIVPIDLRNLKSGTYSLIIRQGNSYGVVRLIIIK